MLQDIKTQIGIIGDSKDGLLNIYIKKAETAVKNYLLINDCEIVNYEEAVIEFVCVMYNKRGSEGVNSETQGSRTTSYEQNIIPYSVKALLPLPKIRITG